MRPVQVPSGGMATPSGAEGDGPAGPAGGAIPPAGDLAAADFAADEFDVLLALGRTRGGLTPDDLMAVLQSVELSHDLIVEVVGRIRDAGIEFVEDTATTSCR